MFGFKIVSKCFEDDLRREIRSEMNEEIDCRVENRIEHKMNLAKLENELNGYKLDHELGINFNYLELNVMLTHLYIDMNNYKVKARLEYIRDNQIDKFIIDAERLKNII